MSIKNVVFNKEKIYTTEPFKTSGHSQRKAFTSQLFSPVFPCQADNYV